MLDNTLPNSSSLTKGQTSARARTIDDSLDPGGHDKTRSVQPAAQTCLPAELLAPSPRDLPAIWKFGLPGAAPVVLPPEQAREIQAIGDFCVAARDLDPTQLVQSARQLEQQLGTGFAGSDLAPALAEVFAAARTAALQEARSESDVLPVRKATLGLAQAIDSRWVRLFPLPVLDTRFPGTGFNETGFNAGRRKGMRAFHKASATIASKVALVSPSLTRVMRRNEAFLAALQQRRPPVAALHGVADLPDGVTPREVALAQWTPATVCRIRDQLLEHMDDAFLTNLVRNAQKAGGALWKRVSGDDKELTRTRSQLVAEMLDLGNPDSALNRALDQTAPRMLLHRPLADMGVLETNDLMLKLAADTLDGVARPTAAECRRTAALLAELAPAGQREFDRIHIDAMKRLQAATSTLPAGSPAQSVQKLVDRETRRTSKRVDKARSQLFDDFRRRNGGEFGFNSLSEQVRENTNIEYYKTLLLPGAVWASGARLVGAAFTVIGGPVGTALTVASAAVLQYVTAITSQVSAGATGAASADLRPFDSATMPKPIVDPETYWNQRRLGTTVHKIGLDALHAYTRPGNPSARACRLAVHRIESVLGYDLKARTALAPELSALAEYHDFMMGRDTGGLDQAVPAPVRIAQLLHSFADELPALQNLAPEGSEMSEAARRTVIESLIEAINRRSGRQPPADVSTIASRARRHVDDLLHDTGLERHALAALMAPDAAAMHAGGVDFSALIQALLQSAGLMEQGLFDSRGFLSAQYRGLLVNAVGGLAVQLVIGIAGFFGISAATAAGTPVAGLGAAAAFTAASLVAGSFSRDAGAVAWYRKDREAQSDSHLYRLMRSPEAQALTGDRDRHIAQIEKAMLANHVPLHKRRMDQLMHGMRAAWEKELVLGSARQAQMGFDMLHALEQDPVENDYPRFAAELAGQSLDAMHEATAVRRHQALLDTHEASKKVVATTARAAQEVLRRPDASIQARADGYLQDRESYGVRESYRYREENPRFFLDASGAIPAREALARLRTLAREAFDRHLGRHRDKSGFEVSSGELEALKTALRTPHADEATELWLAGLDLQLPAQNLLSGGDRPHHLDVSTLRRQQVALLRESHVQQATELEERRRAMRIITNDLLALQAGKFDDILDPLGVIGGSLAHFADAAQFSRHYRTNNDLAFIAFTRGTARFAGQVIPVTFRGAAAALVVLAGGGLAIAQASNARTGAFTLGKLDPDAAQNLRAHGIELTALQSSGTQPKFGSLAGPVASGLLNAVQPQTNPMTFQSSGQLQSFQAGFVPDDPSFDSLAGASTADRRHFLASAEHWGAGLVSPDAIAMFLRSNAGATQLKLRIDRKLHKLPDARFVPREDRIRWSAARHISRRGWTARLGSFLPSRYWHDLSYAKNARHHFDQVQNDRHKLAASLVVAGHRLAAMGAPAEPPLESELDRYRVEFASAMLHNLLLQPGAGRALFTDTPPESATAQHKVIMQAVLRNPWYLLRLVHFAMTRTDPDDKEQNDYRRELEGFRKTLAADVLRASMPLAVRRLRHDIALSAERPMTADRLAALDEDLRRSRADVEAMSEGPERKELLALVTTLSEGIAAVDSVDF